jgi:hypothetical protein
MELPKVMESNIDTLEAIEAIPKSDNEEPNRAKTRKDKPLPRLIQSRTLIDEPK